MSVDPTDAPRCTATAKGTGERCKRRPVPGGTVCVKHGGGAPQVRAAAEQRQAEAAAVEQVNRLWIGLGNAEPVRDPVESMARLAGALEHFLEEVGGKVNALQHVSSGKDLSQLRGEIVLWEKVAKMLSLLLDSMARLGIAERRIEIDAEIAGVLIAAFQGAIASVALVPADRDLVLRRFLGGLGLPEDRLAELEGPVGS